MKTGLLEIQVGLVAPGFREVTYPRRQPSRVQCVTRFSRPYPKLTRYPLPGWSLLRSVRRDDWVRGMVQGNKLVIAHERGDDILLTRSTKELRPWR